MSKQKAKSKSSPPKNTAQSQAKKSGNYFSPDNIYFCFGILILFWFIFFRELLTGSSWLHDDFPYVFYPGKFLAAVSLAEGTFPFWNPFSFSGMPFFADPQIAVLYPLHLLLVFFVSNSYLHAVYAEWVLLVHFIIASVSAFYLGKELKFGNFASLITAVLYAYTSFLVNHAIHYNVIEAVSWLPLIFLFVLKFINTSNLKWIIWASLIMALSVLGGYPQVYFFIYIFISLYIFYRIFSGYREKETEKAKKLIFGYIVFIIISVGLSSVQTLPTYEFSKNSERVNVTYDFAKQGSIHPYDLVTMFIPKFFGTFSWNESAKELPYWSTVKNGGHQDGPFMYSVSTLYFTLLPLIFLIPVMLYFRREKKKDFSLYFYISFAVIVFLFSLGGNFFLHKIFFDFVPLFSNFRNPAHAAFLINFIAAIVAGYGVNVLYSDERSFEKYLSKKYLYLTGGAVILIFILFGTGTVSSFFPLAANKQISEWTQKQSLHFLVLALAYLVIIYFGTAKKTGSDAFKRLLLFVLLIDCYLFGFNQNNGSVDPEKLYAQNANILQELKAESKNEVFRINMRDNRNMLFQRYQGAFDRLQFIEGINVLKLNRTVPPGKPGESSQSYDLLNVKYRIKTDTLSRTSSLEAVNTYLPRAKMFYDVKIIENEDELKNYMESDEYDYRKTIILEKNPGALLSSVKYSSNADSTSAVHILKYDMSEVVIEADAAADGFLLLSDIYYPAWKCYVDESETEIFRADYSLRAVFLTKGKHSIRFVYDSSSFNYGKYISILSLVLFAGILTFSYIKKRRKENGEDKSGNI